MEEPWSGDRLHEEQVTAADVERAVDEALGGATPASQVAGMIDALKSRRLAFGREMAAAPDGPERDAWAKKIAEIDRQIGVLREEQAVSAFVEMTVRSASTRPRTGEMEEEDEE